MRLNYIDNNKQFAAIAGIVGAALGVIGGIASNISGDKTRKKLEELGKTDPQYFESQYAKQKFGLAQSLLNARMPGSAATEKNIAVQQANTQGNVQRNATDSSQALALAAAGQGQADNAYQQAGVAENQDYMGRVQNYNQGAQGMVDENTKTYDDSVRRWQDQINITLQRHAIRQQQGQNMSNMGSSISSMGGMMGGGGAGK